MYRNAQLADSAKTSDIDNFVRVVDEKYRN